MFGGHITLWGENLGGAGPVYEACKICILGVMAEDRHTFAPSIDTFSEQGYPIFMESMRGLAALKGTAKDKIAHLIEAFSKTMRNPKFLAESKALRLPLGKRTGKKYGQRLRQLREICLDLWKKHPLEINLF